MVSFSFVIPVYNSSDFIIDCLDSINNQSVNIPINIIIIDDKSIDDTIELVKNYKFNNNINLEIYYNEKNMKQGYSRNYGLSKVTSDYVMFLDSDDFIAEDTISRSLAILNEKHYDMLMLGWIYYNNETKKYAYSNAGKLLTVVELENNECADILATGTYFSTPVFYNVNYLKENEIKYGEGYFYEDFEFVVSNAMKAQSIYLLHFPLYCVRVNEKSTTKSNYHTDIHYLSYINALKGSLKQLYNRSEYSIAYFYSYVLDKLYTYAYNRVPKKYRKRMLQEAIDLLSVNKGYPTPPNLGTFKNYVFKNRLIDNKKASEITYKYLRIKFGKKRRLFKSKLKNVFKKARPEVIKGKILFMGFDLDYRGNSKYLYEAFKELNVENMHFLKESDDQNYHLNTAEFIIFESWNNVNYQKKDNQKYLQLWHGTPLKKMLFASDEKILIKRNSSSYRTKFWKYQQWDYLVVDNPQDKQLFDECFPYHNYSYIESGYPRVKYLVDNKNNEELKKELKQKYHIEKPLVLYVPTWRDKEIISDDRSWLLNIDDLSNNYPEFQFYSAKHRYLNDDEREDEIQELLLICDIIISDYSSIVFDGVTIDKKIILYQPDIKEYEEYRGLFEQSLEPFKNNIVYNLTELKNLLNDVNLIPEVKITNTTNYHNTNKMILDIIKKNK